jgi:hypothetical protein
MKQGIVELENQHLDIVNWLLKREGNPDAEINFKRVVKLIAEYKAEQLTKEKYYRKQLHSIKKAETLGQAKLIATETLL